MSGVWVDAALVHKKVHDKFRLIPISHSYPLLQEWIFDTREWILRIQKDTSLWKDGSGNLPRGAFPKNENSCQGKFGSCPFLDICRSTSDPTELEETPAGYVREEWKPFETLGLAEIINAPQKDPA
jgi:hypothetical protein